MNTKPSKGKEEALPPRYRPRSPDLSDGTSSVSHDSRSEHSTDSPDFDRYERAWASPDKYVVLMETNERMAESWYTFIRLEGNEKALALLQSQFDLVDWELIEDLSTFDLDLENPVSAITAKEMTRLDLNSTMFHRKFDGTLQNIDFNFSETDSNEQKIGKVYDMLRYGAIEDFLRGEDIDSDMMTSDDEEDDREEERAAEEEQDNAEEGNGAAYSRVYITATCSQPDDKTAFTIPLAMLPPKQNPQPKNSRR